MTENPPVSAGIKKAEQYGWNTDLGPKGYLDWVDKHAIKVDHEHYQRAQHSGAKVQKIVRHFCWAGFSVIIVVMRQDGTMWCVDGQQRLAAAKKRPEVTDVPCLIFDGEIFDIKKEAGTFLLINTARGPVRATEKIRAKVTIGDENATKVVDMVEKYGYQIVTNGGATGKQVSFVRSIEIAMQANEQQCRSAWDTCVRLYRGEAIKEKMFQAVYYLIGHLQKTCKIDIEDHWCLDVLIEKDPADLMKAAEKAASAFAKGGPKVWAHGVLEVLNFRRTSNRIPPIFSATD